MRTFSALLVLVGVLAPWSVLPAQQSAIAELALGFETETRAKVETPFAEGLATLCKRYGEACAVSLKNLSSQGKLDDAVAVKQEIEAIAQGKTMPVVDPIGTTPELARLHGIFRQEAAKLEKERNTKLDAIAETYDLRLQRLEDNLIRQSKLPEANQAKELRARHKRLCDNLRTRPASFAVATSVFDTVKKLAIKMTVDGDDTVKVRDGSLWIEHGSWNAPGGIMVNGAAWTPLWTGKNSDLYIRFNPSLAAFGSAPVTLTKEKGRGGVKIVEQPSEGNNRTLSFRLDDGAGGADEYEVTVTW